MVSRAGGKTTPKSITLFFILCASGILIVFASGCGPAGPNDAQQAEAIAALIDRLETRDWDKAVEELVRIGKPAVDPLIAALDRCPNPFRTAVRRKRAPGCA